MKAAIYIRVSTDRQNEEGFSMEAQHDILMNLLEKKGLELYRVYSDPGISGKTMKKRPGVMQMIADMKAGRFDAVVIHKLDRLSRNQGDLYSFIELINKLNVRLIIAAQGDEEIDTKSPMGKAFLMFSAIWAEIYIDNLREETLKGLKKKAEKGGRHMSRAPLGYDFDADRNLIINEVEAKLIREVYSMYLAGKGVVLIAKHMNGHSRGKEGGVWDSKYVRTVLSNPTYAGKNHFKVSDWTEEQRIITDGDHEAIISQDDFDKVQEMMKLKKDGYMSKHSYEYAYGGIVRCAKCGATYVGYGTRHKDKEYKQYRCRNNYANKTCDAPAISERIMNQIVFERLFVSSVIIQESKKDQKKKDKRALQREIDVSNKRRRNWMLALGDGNLSSDDYAALIDEEEARMKAVYEEYKEDEIYESEIPIEELQEMMANLKDNWEYLESDTQKQLIQSMFRRIVISKENNKWSITDILTA